MIYQITMLIDKLTIPFPDPGVLTIGADFGVMVGTRRGTAQTTPGRFWLI
jgi:hypothetical protein